MPHILLDGWTVVPLVAAVVALGLVGFRAWVVMFRAALDGPSFSRELGRQLAAGEREAARALAERLRPAWAAELALRALATREPEQMQFELEVAREELELAAQNGLLAIRALGRLALPLSLAIAIVELGRGFDVDPARALERGMWVSQALSRGIFAVSTGMAASLACQVGYGVLSRDAKQRLREVQLTSDVFALRG